MVRKFFIDYQVNILKVQHIPGETPSIFFIFKLNLNFLAVFFILELLEKLWQKVLKLKFVYRLECKITFYNLSVMGAQLVFQAPGKH